MGRQPRSNDKKPMNRKRRWPHEKVIFTIVDGMVQTGIVWFMVSTARAARGGVVYNALNRGSDRVAVFREPERASLAVNLERGCRFGDGGCGHRIGECTACNWTTKKQVRL